MKSKIFVIVLLFSSFIFIRPVFADGMMHIYDPDMYRWGLVNESQQFTAINYENGAQKMILSVDVAEMRGEKAVWLFPVPAKPDKTAIDITKGFPRLLGRDVKEMTDATIFGTFSWIRLSQIYTFPELIALYSFGAGTGGKGLEEAVTIHERIEKMGLATELVSAKESNALYNYLTNKGLDLPSDSKAILDEYTGKNYSFVVSWISDIAKFKNESATRDKYGRTINTIAVSITFPADKIYFPLKPTSVYGTAKVPILIYVMGHVTPELYPEIRQDTQVNYFVESGYYTVSPEFSSFFNGKTKINELGYTKIKINTSSRNLKEDLWIQNSTPPDIALSDLIRRGASAWGLIVFVLCSCSASLLSAMVVFGREEISKRKFALFGLWNFFSLIVFAIALIFLQTKKLEPALEDQLKSQGLIIIDGRKIKFVVLFSVFFLVISIVFQIVMQSIF